MGRRRSWAASSRLPPKIACRFTLAEQAVLAVVAVEVARKGDCTLTLEHIAALAGVCRTTVKNARREALGLGLVRIEERRRTAWRNDPNRVTIISREWSAWLRFRTRKGGGGKSVPSPSLSHRESEGSTGQQTPSRLTEPLQRAAGRQRADRAAPRRDSDQRRKGEGGAMR